MKWANLPLCYYPTTVVLVDDQKIFLKELELGLNEDLLCQFYNDPKNLVHYFENYRSDHFINHCMSVDEDSLQNDHITQNVNIRKIYEGIYNPRRFEQISILVADYAMPNINGLECCAAVHDKFIKKFLLTGEAQYDLAITAFNNKIIDKFIEKSTKGLMEVINNTILDLQMQYFIEQSATIASHQAPPALNDAVFSQFFHEVYKDNNIVEFYLLDNQGSFLLLDKQAKPFWLVVKEDAEVNNLYQHAAIEQAPKTVINALKNRESIPYFYTDQDLQTPPADWDRFLHKANKLVGNNVYYYALIKGNNIYKINTDKILSFQEYLKKQH